MLRFVWKTAATTKTSVVLKQPGAPYWWHWATQTNPHTHVLLCMEEVSKESQ